MLINVVYHVARVLTPLVMMSIIGKMKRMKIYTKNMWMN